MREESVNRDPDEWWAILAPVKKVFFRNLLLLVGKFIEGESLRVSFTEQGFTLVLKSDRYSTLQGAGTGGTSVEEPEVWWSGLNAGERVFVMELSDVIRLLERDHNEYLEICRTRCGFQATRLMRLRGAVGGRAMMN